MYMADDKIVVIADRIFGASCAAFHFSGAIKSVPGIAKLPIDLTAIFLSFSVTTYVIRALCCGIYISSFGGAHLFLQSLLNICIIFSALKSNSSQILYDKLFQVTAVGFVMTLLSFSLSSSAQAFKSFIDTCYFFALLCSLTIPPTLLLGLSVRGGPVETEFSRVQYQLVGILFASASVVGATSLIQSWPLYRVRKLFALTLFIFGSAILGGRASFISQISATLVAASLMYGNQTEQARRSSVIVLVIFMTGSYVFTFFLFFIGAEELVIFKRLFFQSYVDHDIRALLWSMAASNASIFGLGTASFGPNMGLGDVRRWYPHNLVLEAFVELGVPGLILFCMLLFTAASSLYLCRKLISDEHLSILAGFTFICGAQIFTSTDLGNRMAWFWLGLLSGTSCRTRWWYKR